MFTEVKHQIESWAIPIICWCCQLKEIYLVLTIIIHHYLYSMTLSWDYYNDNIEKRQFEYIHTKIKLNILNLCSTLVTISSRSIQKCHYNIRKGTIKYLRLVRQISFNLTTLSCFSCWRILISLSAVIGNWKKNR